ncbi:MAG: hypothetical protein SNI45_01520 [Rikenellaceae bacterium]
MRKFFTLAFFALLTLVIVGCSNDDDRIYISTSGEGAIVVDYDSPVYLYRMVLFSTDTEQELYLMGNSAYVDGDAEFLGTGAVVKFTLPNTDDNTTLLEQTFDLSDDSYSASYDTYVNYTSGDADFVDISSGTVLIRRSSNYYDLRLVGSDADSNTLIISYTGYIYRTFVEVDDDTTDDDDDDDDDDDTTTDDDDDDDDTTTES